MAKASSAAQLTPVEETVKFLTSREYMVLTPSVVLIKSDGAIALVYDDGDYTILDAVPDLVRATGRPQCSATTRHRLTPES